MKKFVLGLVAIAVQLSAMATTWTLNGSTYTVDITATKSLGAGTTYTAAPILS